jgi:cytochrome oxidase Cu insertion factor (SCO1/SenC/PrrC family)
MRLRIAFVLAAVAVVAALAAGWLLVDRAGKPAVRALADIGGAFELVDQTGRTVTDREWPGKYLLVYFGYTFCPDVCPTELQKMIVALDSLPERDAARVQPLFITVDPARDTVQVMADYVAAFHPRLVGLTGSEAQVRAAAKAYRVYFAKAAGSEGEDYLMDHSSFIYLIDPNGDLADYFSPATSVEDMARAMAGRL